ncbi:sulfur carrier protein ThiS [Tepidibacillus fermentans]|uniref:Sulfur carrier protein n=1 Tax=Tepidibacillus fermentans TaxID=1281767 RepID=A0A4R3KEL3_9BACI|nr:sulfur carrier protein ThiS [Tepidibacillus fermentans]TCS81786.1 sulfur carrier protein [Tepidibacillus fermentans]
MVVNGKEITGFAGKTVAELLNELKLNQTLVVVEINFDIIPKDQYDIRILQETDKVEIVSVVGGG